MKNMDNNLKTSKRVGTGLDAASSEKFTTELADDEVFVFGSNEQGFHGAGAAGLACRGDARNNWRQDEWFIAALDNPTEIERRVGKWAVLGVGRGFQKGREGMSYAIATVTKPGAKRSITRRDIYHQLVDLWAFAKEHPERRFLIAPIGTGYAGWTHEEMQEVWDFLIKKHGRPDNVRLLWEES